MQISVGVCLYLIRMDGSLPHTNLKAEEMARCLLKEIIPRFGIPVSIGSDNGPAFMAEVVQLMAKGLGITWKLHMAYHSQSSGKLECVNRTLKLVSKTVSGDPSAVGSITAHSITKD
jgi:transposase InsO family protein